MRAPGVPLVLALAAGCAASPAGRPDYPLLSDETDPAAVAARRHEASAERREAQVAAPVHVVKRRRAGEIPRAELHAVLDAGPGRFLAGLILAADVADDGRTFRGWRIDSFFPDDARFAAVDIVPGDVILRVNGKVIVRPEHLQDVWDGLRDAAVLTVEVRRGPHEHGDRFLLDYAIVDSPSGSRDKIAP